MIFVEWDFKWGKHYLTRTVQTFFRENLYEILHAQYTWKVPEKGFKIYLVLQCRERLACAHLTHACTT